MQPVGSVGFVFLMGQKPCLERLHIDPDFLHSRQRFHWHQHIEQTRTDSLKRPFIINIGERQVQQLSQFSRVKSGAKPGLGGREPG